MAFVKENPHSRLFFYLTKYIYLNLNHKKLMCAVCLDVAKAFDCINHDILLYKMSKIGFQENTIRSFNSYLSRTQVVCYNDVESSKVSVKTGIGQGTILCPLIFIFYINDLISIVDKFKVNMYVDDCILYSSGNNWNRMSQILQPELDKMHAWCTHNRLKLNVKKSKTLIIGSRSKLGRVDYYCTLNLSGKYLLIRKCPSIASYRM